MPCQHEVVGPAVIQEATTNIVLPPGWKATLSSTASYVLSPIDG